MATRERGIPSIEGVTAGDLPESPMEALRDMLGAHPKTAQQELIEALEKLRRVARLDPRLQEQVYEAICALTEGGEHAHDHDGRPGQSRRDPGGASGNILGPE